MTDRVEQFLEYLAVECGLAANSIAAYRNDLSHFCAYLTGRGQRSFGDVRSRDIVGFLTHEKARRQSASSISRALAAVPTQPPPGEKRLQDDHRDAPQWGLGHDVLHPVKDRV